MWLCVVGLPVSAVLELQLNQLLCHEQMSNPKLAINLPEGFLVMCSRWQTS